MVKLYKASLCFPYLPKGGKMDGMTGNQAPVKPEKPKVLIVHNNGKDGLSEIVEVLSKKGYSAEVVHQSEMPDRASSLETAVIYDYHTSSSPQADAERFETMARRYSTIPVFVLAPKESLALLNIEAHKKHVFPVPNESAGKTDKMLDDILSAIASYHNNTMPKGVILFYDPSKLFRSYRHKLKDDGNIWVESDNDSDAFISKMNYNSDFCDAIVMDFRNPNKDPLFIETIRRTNPRIPIIAVVEDDYVNSCKADYTVIKERELAGLVKGVGFEQFSEQQVSMYIDKILQEQNRKKIEALQAITPAEAKRAEDKKKPVAFIVMGPPASGKSTIADCVEKLLGPDKVAYIKKYSTRPIRPTEQDGLDLLHVSAAQFEHLAKTPGSFMHEFEYGGERYGVPTMNTLEALKSGKHMFTASSDIKQLDVFQKILGRYTQVPIMLFADHDTLVDRIRKRGFASGKEEMRVTTMSKSEQAFDESYDRFRYALFTDNRLNPLDVAQRILSIINWESAQHEQLPPAENSEAYANHVVRALFGADYKDIIEEKQCHLKLDREAIEAYSSARNYDPTFLKRLPPLQVTAVMKNHSHLGFFFSSGKAKTDFFSWDIIFDCIEHKLRNSKPGILPKAVGRHCFAPRCTEHFSPFGLAASSSPTVIDGLIYSLADDYCLQPKDAAPHAVSFSAAASSSIITPASPEVITHHTANYKQNPYVREILHAIKNRA
jgi:guanylate kinase